jgi:hypothetical protein
MKIIKAFTVSTLIWSHLLQAGVASAPAGMKELEVEAPFEQLEMKLELEPGLIESLRPFTNSLKRKLDNMLLAIAELKSLEKEQHLVASLEQILSKDKRRFRELLAFEILERALLIHKVMLEETIADNPHDAQVRVRLLTRAIELVRKKYFQKDQSFLNQESEVDYTRFAHEYFEYLSNLNKSVFDATAQYRIEKLTLQFLAYDLSHDPFFQKHAVTITTVNDRLIGFPKKIKDDQSALKKIRSLRRIKKDLVAMMDKSYELIGRNVYLKAPLLSGDKSDTVYTGTISFIGANKNLQIDWTRRNGYKMQRAYRQSHPKTEVVLNKVEHKQFKQGQIVSMFDFHENGTRFTRTGRLIEMYENDTASVQWTHASSYSQVNSNAVTVEENDTWNSFVALKSLK